MGLSKPKHGYKYLNRSYKYVVISIITLLLALVTKSHDPLSAYQSSELQRGS